MSTNELLERRAERGVTRGPDKVWADAQLTVASTGIGRGNGSTLLYRAAVAAWVVGFVAIGLLRPGTSNSIDAAENDREPVQSDEPLPAPLLIDGGTLKRDRGGVSQPFDPDFDGDDIFDDILPNNSPPEFLVDQAEQLTTTVIFADPARPFERPILGVELLEGGGFRPWGINMTDAELTDLTQHLERVDGQWSMSDAGGLVQVARLEGEPYDSLKFGWQFDFQLPGNNEVTIQAETADGDRVVNEWLWIARLVGQGESTATVRPVEVLGREGFVVVTADGSRDQGVVWEADGFVYRMTASRVEGNTSFGRDSTEDIARLRIVDRSEWVDAIARSSQTSAVEWIVGLLMLLVLLGVASSTVLFLARRSFQAAGLAAGTLIGWLYLAGSPTHWGTLALTMVGLALAWSLHRHRRQPAGVGPS